MLKEHKYKKIIEDSGYKKKAIAEKIGISNVLLSYYLNGSRTMPVRIEVKIKEIIT